jgi:hypothetical protein
MLGVDKCVEVLGGDGSSSWGILLPLFATNRFDDFDKLRIEFRGINYMDTF